MERTTATTTANNNSMKEEEKTMMENRENKLMNTMELLEDKTSTYIVMSTYVDDFTDFYTFSIGESMEKMDVIGRRYTEVFDILEESKQDKLLREEEENREEITTDKQEEILQFIVNNHIAARFAWYIVRKRAASIMVTSETCSKILKAGSYYDVFYGRKVSNDHLMFDIESTVNEQLFKLVIDNKLVIDKSRCVFGSYINKKGEEKSCFVLLYRAVDNAILENKGGDGIHRKRVKDENGNIHFVVVQNVGSDGITTNSKGEEKRANINSIDYDTEYINSYNAMMEREGLFDYFDTIYNRSDINSFIQFIERELKEKQTRRNLTLKVFDCMIRGYNLQTIAIMCNKSEKTIKRVKTIIRDLYNNWKEKGNCLDYAFFNRVVYGTTTTQQVRNSGAIYDGKDTYGLLSYHGKVESVVSCNQEERESAEKMKERNLSHSFIKTKIDCNKDGYKENANKYATQYAYKMLMKKEREEMSKKLKEMEEENKEKGYIYRTDKQGKYISCLRIVRSKTQRCYDVFYGDIYQHSVPIA